MRTALKLHDAQRDCPTLVTAYVHQGKGEKKLEAALRLSADGGAFVLGGATGWRVWRATRRSNVPDYPLESADPVATLERVQPVGAGEATRRGVWKGVLEVQDDGFPRVSLERTVGYIVVKVSNDQKGGWSVSAMRGERWFSAPAERGDVGIGHLGDAVEAAFRLALNLAGEVCATRDVDRRGAYDSSWAATHPEKARVFVDPTLKLLRRPDQGLNLVADHELLDRVAGELAALDLTPMADLVRRIRSTDDFRSVLQGAAPSLVSLMGKPLDPHRWNRAIGALHALGGLPWAPTAPQGSPGPLQADALPATEAETEAISRMPFSAFSARAARLCDMAESLIAAPGCEGPGKAEAQAKLQVARAHLEALRLASDASGGLNLMRARLLGPIRDDLWRVHLTSGRDVQASVSTERAGLLVAGGMVVVALTGAQSAHITELRLDLVQTTAIAAPTIRDVVRANRHVLDTAALAAARAARSCTSPGASEAAAEHGPVDSAVRCARCGLVALAPAMHLAVGSLLCSNTGTDADNWPKIRGKGLLYLVQHFHGAVVDAEKIKTRPTASPLPVTRSWLASLPVYTVLAYGKKPNVDKGDRLRYPAMVMRGESQKWHFYSIVDGLATYGADDAELAENINRGVGEDFAEGWVLVPGRAGQHAHRAHNETASRVALALANLPGWGEQLRAERAHEDNAFLDRAGQGLRADQPWEWVSDIRSKLAAQIPSLAKDFKAIANKRELSKLGADVAEGWYLEVSHVTGTKNVAIPTLTIIIRRTADDGYQAGLRFERTPMTWTEPETSRVLALRALSEALSAGVPLTVTDEAPARGKGRPGRRTRQARAAREEQATTSSDTRTQVAAPPVAGPVHVDQPPAGGADDAAILAALLASIKAVGAELRAGNA